MSIGYFQWTKIGCFRWTRSGSFRRTLTTGVCAAIHSKELSSEIGAKGIAKKMATFAVISLAHILDEYVLKEGGAIQTMTSIFYIVNESISILENAIRTGLPVPEKLKSIIRSLGESEESSEISDEKEEK